MTLKRPITLQYGWMLPAGVTDLPLGACITVDARLPISPREENHESIELDCSTLSLVEQSGDSCGRWQSWGPR